MADAGLQAPDIPAPPAPQVPQQAVQQAQQIPHLNWSQNLSQNFHKKMQKLIYSELTIG